VSTIIPEYLTDCWRWAADKEDLLRGCELIINTIPAVTYCENCGKEFGTVEHGKKCPHCGSDRTYLVRGNEVEIKEITV
jgi:hydrogenase nickel incorporation protein HypA/HybF